MTPIEAIERERATKGMEKPSNPFGMHGHDTSPHQASCVALWGALAAASRDHQKPGMPLDDAIEAWWWEDGSTVWKVADLVDNLQRMGYTITRIP